MTSERPTVRPVTLPRLVELVYLCGNSTQSTDEVEVALDVTHRRARETILEVLRIGLILEPSEDTYEISAAGREFLDAVLDEVWEDVSGVLATQSPHYGLFLRVLEDDGACPLDELLENLSVAAEKTDYTFNQTGIEVLGDWSERLGSVQRNAFTGDYYSVEREEITPEFQSTLLEVYDELEETTGVNLRQRYISIPKLREWTCERLRCRRSVFDDYLVRLCEQNIGKLELSGAPLDTEAKKSALGIKQIELAEADTLVSTSQSTDRVMSGVTQFDKQYYYLAIYDRNLTDKLHQQ
ncbi:hypothetical protein [Halorussus halophilus]|uniref:hypothetical protein n=1 Tax=Halorussus halophilus TaxID=2650975 RepID=UPI0013019508|nr:hypothetical protein [Halorussus halophilus]